MKRWFSLMMLPLLLSCSNANYDRRMEKAEALVGVGEREAALDEYREVVKGCPSYGRCAEALLRMGDLEAYLAHDPKTVLKTYARIGHYFPLKEASRIAHARRAAVYERLGDYLGAAEEYAQLLQFFPKYEGASRYLLKLGESYLAMGNFNQARIELRGLTAAAVDIDPAVRQEALFAYAESFFLEGRLGLAQKAYSKLVEEYPDSPFVGEARMKIATCQEERGFLGDASRTLSEAKKEYPNKAVIEDRLKAMQKRGKGAPPKRPEDKEDTGNAQ